MQKVQLYAPWRWFLDIPTSHPLMSRYAVNPRKHSTDEFDDYSILSCISLIPFWYSLIISVNRKQKKNETHYLSFRSFIKMKIQIQIKFYKDINMTICLVFITHSVYFSTKFYRLFTCPYSRNNTYIDLRFLSVHFNLPRDIKL